jgi:hypothetical protein
MTKDQAIEILTNVTETISLNYKDHQTVKEALKVLSTKGESK